MTGGEQYKVPLPAEVIETSLNAFLGKKIELHSDMDSALERARTESVAVLSAVVAAAPLLIAQAALDAPREPVEAPEAVVRVAAAAAFNSVREYMGFPTDFEGAPEPLQARYMDMQRAAFAAAAAFTAAWRLRASCGAPSDAPCLTFTTFAV